MTDRDATSDNNNETTASKDWESSAEDFENDESPSNKLDITLPRQHDGKEYGCYMLLYHSHLLIILNYEQKWLCTKFNTGSHNQMYEICLL